MARLVGHTSLIWCGAISPDGHWALTGGAERHLRLWNLDHMRLERLLSGHEATVNSVAFSVDGARALSGANDRKALLWEISTGKPLRQFKGHAGQVSSVAFSPDGRSAVTAAWDDENVRIWNLELSDASPQCLKAGALGCDAVAYSPDGRLVLAGGMDGTLRVWIVSSGAEIRRIPAHAGRIYGLAVSPDERHVATCGRNGRVRLWNLDLHKLVETANDQAGVASSMVGRAESKAGVSLVNGKFVLMAKRATVSH
jgi:WD40 repeat protein